MTDSLTWGAFVPHGGADDFTGWTSADAWACMRDTAIAYDELGFDHLWLSDHLMASGGDRSGLYFEGYSVLAALTQITQRAKLGALVTCSLYRSAGMLAKQASAIDVMSNGRFILGLGGGWDEAEFTAYGYDFPPPGERVDVFGETLEALVRLWSEDSVDLDGHHVHLRAARCSPKPVTRPPVWTGTHGRRGLRIAARHADVANWNCSLDDFERLSRLLDEACVEEGRDRASIDTSVFRLAVIGDAEAALGRLLAAQGAPEDLVAAVKAQHFMGAPEEVVPKVQAFVDAGARHIVIMCLGATSAIDAGRRFIEEVAPNVHC